MWQLAGSYYRFNIATLLFHPQYAPFKHTLPGLGNRYSQALGHADTTRTWMMLSDSCPMPLGQCHRSFTFQMQCSRLSVAGIPAVCRKPCVPRTWTANRQDNNEALVSVQTLQAVQSSTGTELTASSKLPQHFGNLGLLWSAHSVVTTALLQCNLQSVQCPLHLHTICARKTQITFTSSLVSSPHTSAPSFLASLPPPIQTPMLLSHFSCTA